MIVCGHTHVQYDVVVGRQRVVNAGSVGWAYEGKPGAYWLELGPRSATATTEYGHESTAAALIEIAWPGPLDASDLLTPASPDDAITAFG